MNSVAGTECARLAQIKPTESPAWMGEGLMKSHPISEERLALDGCSATAGVGGRQEHMNLEGNSSGGEGGLNREGPHRLIDWNAPWQGLGVWSC